MGLVRGMARTAVVAGTATAVSNKVSKHQAEKWSNDGSMPGSQPAPAAPVAAAPVDPTTAQLQELANLKAQGIITEEEFAAKKKQILGI